MINQSINDHINVSKSLIIHESNIENIAKECLNVLKQNNKILLCGNGGSAADSIHIAAELVGRFTKERKSLPAYSLASNQSNLTSISNDYGFENVFQDRLRAWGMKVIYLLHCPHLGIVKILLMQ